MALHRRVYVIGLLAASLTAALVLVGLIIITSANTQASSLIAKNRQLDVFADAQRNLVSSQVQFATALRYPLGSSTRRAYFVRASAQQQLGLSQWNQFRRLAGKRGSSSAAAVKLNGDLRALPYIQLKSKPVSTNTTTTTPTSVGASALLVNNDFNAVRLAERGWWRDQLAAHHDAAHHGVLWMIIAGLIALPGVVILLASLARAARIRDADLEERDRDLARVARSNEFEARLQRALELSPSEDRVYAVVAQALEEMVPDLSVEMLLADSSRAHFQQLVTTGPPAHNCTVDSPTACPAAQRGEVMTFESSQALDACPYLKQQGSPCSAVCVPVSVSGLTVGVVHAAGAEHAPPDAPKRTALELISRRASDRIGMMRAFSDSEVQASTDPLTGLSNRRALESSMRRLQHTVDSYAVAFGDLDHFKMVNDKYGHGAGDHALRVFSRVLRDQLRPDDIFGRYGGEEFLVVLPHCDAEEAVQVLERVRVALGVTLVSADCPSFTVSFGVAVHSQGRPFEETISIADGALLDAKRQGRDRVVVAQPARSDVVDTDDNNALEAMAG
ncbi:diguanylate cyclase [uncultured Jatrophihabitans sp.]|uniref:GGDEF domain-containing protein n=1 Tax=uncultured Jatrophihabitans sp. TaxID=1610747 RepID=UPI0035CB8058